MCELLTLKCADVQMASTDKLLTALKDVPTGYAALLRIAAVLNQPSAHAVEEPN